FWDANRMVLARALAGGKGVLNQQEMAAGTSLVPRLDYTLGLGGTALRAFGLAIPKGWVGAPDTRAVALGTLDMGTRLVNKHAGALLEQDGFQFKGLAPRTAEQVKLDNLMRHGEGVTSAGTAEQPGAAGQVVGRVSPWLGRQ